MKKTIGLILILVMVLTGTVSAFAFGAEDTIASSSVDFTLPSDDNLENPFGNLIADSYIYEARKKGAEDIDLALVNAESIKAVLPKGEIKMKDVRAVSDKDYESLVVLEMSGKDILKLAENDASLGSKQSEYSFSYSGLRFSYNVKRISMDRLTDLRLYDEFGITGERTLDENETYTVCCNRRTAELIAKTGEYTELRGKDGKNISQSDALADYLFQLEEIPGYYSTAQGRKVMLVRGDLESIFEHPGRATKILIAEIAAVILVLIVLFEVVIPRIKRRG